MGHTGPVSGSFTRLSRNSGAAVTGRIVAVSDPFPDNR
jgi:hypothetical protein